MILQVGAHLVVPLPLGTPHFDTPQVSLAARHALAATYNIPLSDISSSVGLGEKKVGNLLDVTKSPKQFRYLK